MDLEKLLQRFGGRGVSVNNIVECYKCLASPSSFLPYSKIPTLISPICSALYYYLLYAITNKKAPLKALQHHHETSWDISHAICIQRGS